MATWGLVFECFCLPVCQVLFLFCYCAATVPSFRSELQLRCQQAAEAADCRAGEQEQVQLVNKRDSLSRSGFVDAAAGFVGEQIFSPFREILQEIQRLRLEHEQASQPTPEKAQQNPTLLTELRLLRYPQAVALNVWSSNQL